MNNTITLHKQDGVNYRNPVKAYDLARNGVTVGTLQTWGTVWEVLDSAFNLVSKHTTIKAAVRVAGRALSPYDFADIEMYSDREEDLQALYAELAAEENGADDIAAHWGGSSTPSLWGALRSSCLRLKHCLWQGSAAAWSQEKPEKRFY